MRRFIATFLFALASFAAVPAYAQEARGGASAEFTPWSQIRETQADASGTAVTEYVYRVAPLTLRGEINFSDAASVEGGFMYGRLFSPDNAPVWTFSNHYVGTTMELEGIIKWWFLPNTHMRTGASYTSLDRTLNVYDGRNFTVADIKTSYWGPLIGIGFGYDDIIIAKAHFDLFPLLVQSDTSSPLTVGTSSGLSWRVGGTFGYRIKDNLAIIGGASMKRLNTSESFDGADGRRRINWSSVMVGVQIGG